MGSEHYCLRWNNHQSNLLGVFSQLLHDESLVDVTLACSEGASIRAHKVVLSACSSYFRSLFVDHPSRHPIVILKDVGLEELRTLVDFMYKGEVNVQYCQLPALLKTAESLQVKGLAEMTTLSAAGIDTRSVPEPMEECQPQDIRESSDSHDRLEERDSRDKDDRREMKEPRETRDRESKDNQMRDHRESREPRDLREHRDRDQRDIREPRDLRDIRDSREPRDLRESRESREHREHREPREHRELRDSRELRESRDNREPRDLREIRDPRDMRDVREPRDPREVPEASPPRISPLLSVRRFRTETSIDMPTPTHPPIPKDEPPDEPIRPSSPEDDTISIRSNGANDNIGINMSINSHGVLSTRYSPVDRLGVLNTLPHPVLSHPALSSPRNEPIAGPSGLPPVQQVPLSLKKEIDWDRSNEDKGGETSTEYRMQHESEYEGSGRGRIEEGDRGYPCIHCGATFPHQSKLTRHILTTHTLDTLKYRDAILGRPMGLPLIGQFSEPTYMGMPTEESPIDLDIGPVEPGNVVLCKFCGKSFPDVSSLIAHLPVHTGDRPFKCEFCGKAFKLRHHMKDHCRVHTGERPFRCVLCGKTFSRSTILKAHEKTHYPKYARKFLSPSPVDTEEESPHQ
ncbi:uncharacterized protein mamo isoform X2 [Epargyreus clarus]|uniref:uncharacterized protein mamo isoform X2 n=1 Tax=Epargyreus clarus TaxID=520877 RepID=UPI003C2AB3CC